MKPSPEELSSKKSKVVLRFGNSVAIGGLRMSYFNWKCRWGRGQACTRTSCVILATIIVCALMCADRYMHIFIFFFILFFFKSEKSFLRRFIKIFFGQDFFSFFFNVSVTLIMSGNSVTNFLSDVELIFNKPQKYTT